MPVRGWTQRLAATGVALAALTLVSGCGGAGETASSGPGAMHTMADGSVMSGAQMDGMTETPSSAAAGVQPSASARMVCGDEIAAAVQHTYQLSATPTGSSSWSARGRVFTCRYPLVHSLLTLTVKDVDDRAAGGAYFDDLERHVSGTRIVGLESLGFPAFENPRGQVGFLKDGKTLYVDGSSVSRADLPTGTSRTDTAYGVAAAVIACWKE